MLYISMYKVAAVDPRGAAGHPYRRTARRRAPPAGNGATIYVLIPHLSLRLYLYYYAFHRPRLVSDEDDAMDADARLRASPSAMTARCTIGSTESTRSHARPFIFNPYAPPWVCRVVARVM